MQNLFNIIILGVFVSGHLVAVYLHSSRFDRVFFPFNSWKIYHSESSKTTPIVMAYILRMGAQEFEDGRSISTFPADVFPQVRDRYELTNLLLQSYFDWAQGNNSEAKSFALQADSLLRHGHEDLQWEAKFYKVLPVQYYLNPKIIEAAKPLLSLNSKSLHESF